MKTNSEYERPPVRFSVTGGNLDSLLRYEHVISLFADIYRPGLAILEIGSGSAGVTEFLAHRVIGLDASFEKTAKRKSDCLVKVRGAAASLPFRSSSYDVVMSVDMLEHIPHEQRRECLSEMFRVLRVGGRLLIAFPADQAGERLDRRINNSFRARHGRDHPWILEHIESGLPRTSDTVADMRQIGGQRVKISVKGHLWIPIGYLVHRVFTVGLPEWPGLWRFTGPLARLFHWLGNHFNLLPAYRTVLVVEKLTGD